MIYPDRINPYGTLQTSADGPLTSRLVADSARGFLRAQSIPLLVVEPVDVDNETAKGNPPGFDRALRTMLDILLDATASEERNALARELNALVARMAAYISDAKARRAAELKEQLAAVSAEGRVALARLNELKAEEAVLRNAMHGLLERVARATQQWRTALAAEPRGDDFPSGDEIAVWRERVTRTEAALAEAKKPRDEQRGRIDCNLAELRTAKDRLRGLRTKREELRAELEGGPADRTCASSGSNKMARAACGISFPDWATRVGRGGSFHPLRPLSSRRALKGLNISGHRSTLRTKMWIE